MKPRVFYLKWLPFAKAVTVPPFGIFIMAKYKGIRSILIHEITHWRQYLRMGLLKFYLNYFSESLRFRYDHMPMEKEANTREKLYIKYKKNFQGIRRKK